MQLKFAEISLTLQDIETGEIVTHMKRDKDFIWTVSGPIYPKHMKLMAILNDDLRELDRSDDKKVKK